MKHTIASYKVITRRVAPFAGAWIETVIFETFSKIETVAPFAGAWIETKFSNPLFVSITRSLPSRERGLKRGIGQEQDADPASLP